MGQKQHYIPQFYLKNFTSDNSSIGFFKIEDETYRKNVPVKSIMYDKWFYDNDNHIEINLAKAESAWNAAITSVLGTAEREELDKAHQIAQLKRSQADILHFICYTLTRTKGFISGLHGLLNAMVDDLKKISIDFDPKEIPQLYGYDNRHEYIDSVFNAAEDLQAHLTDLSWAYIVNNSTMPFITSDNPTAIINSYFNEMRIHPKFGLDSIGIQLFMPLSSRTCVTLFDGNIYEASENITLVRTADIKTIRNINVVTAKNAFSFLAFDPNTPQCTIKGMSRKRKNVTHAKLGVYEICPGRNMYTFENVKLKDKIIVPGSPIRKEALTRPASTNPIELKRSYAKLLKASTKATSADSSSRVITARLSHHHTIN